jgi:mannan endo-1,4-beta-mannosidase
MKLSIAAYVIAASSLVTASNSFAGSSLYFLPGLSTTDQAYYINTLAGYGAKVVRIWVNQLDTGCVKGSNVVTSVQDFETTIGQYNWDSLAKIDKVLAQLAAKGMKAIISPHDGNVIHNGDVDGNGCDIYCTTYGTSFYGNSNAQTQYDARIKAILTYKSPSSGLQWGNWSQAILAFDLQNEPFQFTFDGANNDPSNWLCNRATNFKKYITDSNIKVATGGIGGDQVHGYNLLGKALTCSNIDIMSIHAYVGQANTWGALLPGFESTAASNKKLLHVEEWGVQTDYSSGFDDQAASLNAQGIPWVSIPPLIGHFMHRFCDIPWLTTNRKDILADDPWIGRHPILQQWLLHRLRRLRSRLQQRQGKSAICHLPSQQPDDQTGLELRRGAPQWRRL